ncbi:phage protease [Methylobacterium sp. Leaf85]|uniref:phage protease n=1 Tax=Methylobacterium sp. Leaf85 TaxID=1736241 RepID=UPI000701647D|nr:phage protease [Methylobacterium sp. Leaf85]KQO53079.1 hypothetical protein ASF08_19330 [Methylobacterium sp. Leaf85]
MSKPAAPKIALCAALPIPAAVEGAVAPQRIHLLPAGEIRTQDGRGPYRVADVAELIRISMPDGTRLPLDENHSTDLAAPRGEPAPARGWITGLHAEADGLWGDVEWTRAGRRLVASKDYRHISPVIAHRPDGTVTGLLRASLVNRPNLLGLAALHQQEDPMDFLAKLRAKLGLAADADEAALMTAVDGRLSDTSAHAALLAPIAKAAGLPETADGAAVLQAVQTLNDPAKMVPAAAVIALQAQLTAEITDRRREKAVEAVDAAIKAGKIAAPTVMRDHYIARHMVDPVAVNLELGSMVSLHAAGGGSALPPKLGADGKQLLDGEEARIVALSGVSVEDYLKTKASLGLSEGAL